MVAMFGASMAAPLAMAPTVKPSARTSASLGTVSVVMMARAAAAADSGPAGPGPDDPADGRPHLDDGERDADQPGLADQDLFGPGADAQGGQCAQVASAASSPGCPVAALALPEVRMHAGHPAGGGPQVGPAQLDRGGRGQVGREDPGGGDRPAVGGGHDGHVGHPAGLDAGRTPGGHEPGSGR